jgi:hypothetical protein
MPPKRFQKDIKPGSEQIFPELEHLAQVEALRTLLNTFSDEPHRAYVVETVIQLCWRLWQWNVETTRDRLLNPPATSSATKPATEVE